MLGGSVTRGLVLILIHLASASVASSQIGWLKDASNAKIPASSVTGQIDGKPVTALKFGELDKAGAIELGSPDLAFDHYKIALRDAESVFGSKVFADLTVTVRRGEFPDGKTFRQILAPHAEQPGPRGPGYWVPEFLSLGMRTRARSQREQKFGEFEKETWITSSIYLAFTGRVEFDKRKGHEITARLYVCFDDKPKSCLAGTAELSIR